jgi:NADPH2:quinone reductase
MRVRGRRTAAHADGRSLRRPRSDRCVFQDEGGTFPRSGCDEAILYTESEFSLEVKRLTENRGSAAMYDSVGKATFEQSLACLKPRGTFVLYRSASGGVPAFDLIRLAPLGSLYVTRPILKHYTLTRNGLLGRAMSGFAAIAAGLSNFRIELLYKLDEAAQAHRDLEGRSRTGELLIAF